MGKALENCLDVNGDRVRPELRKREHLNPEWRARLYKMLDSNKYEDIYLDMRCAFVNLCNPAIERTEKEYRHCEVLALFVGRAADQLLNSNPCDQDVGVVVQLHGKQICSAEVRKKTRGKRTRGKRYAGGCRGVWRDELKATRHALAWCVALGDDLSKGRQKPLFGKLFASTQKIVNAECPDHCWEQMKCPTQFVYDAAQGKVCTDIAGKIKLRPYD